MKAADRGESRESGDLHIAPSRPFILPTTKGTSALESTPRKVDYGNGSLAIDRIRLDDDTVIGERAQSVRNDIRFTISFPNIDSP